MSALIDIKQQFVDIFNTSSGLNVTYSDLKVQGPVAVDATYPPAYRTKNTVVTFTHGDKILNVSYDRTAISDRLAVPGGITLALTHDQDGTIHKLLPLLSKRVGVEIEPHEIVEGTFDVTALPGTIELTTTSASLRWLPGTTLTLKFNGKYRIADGVCELVPVAFSYTPDLWENDGALANQSGGTRTHPNVCTGQFDYTPIANILRCVRSLPTYASGGDGPMIINYYGNNIALIEALRSVDGIPWVISGSNNVNYNLYYAWIVYNGPAKGAKAAMIRGYSPDPNELMAAADIRESEFDNVMLLRLNYSYNGGQLPALLPIHYNNAL